jgi:hypothetical protein
LALAAQRIPDRHADPHFGSAALITIDTQDDPLDAFRLATDAPLGLYDRGERELESIGVVLMSADEVVAKLRRTVAA